MKVISTTMFYVSRKIELNIMMRFKIICVLHSPTVFAYSFSDTLIRTETKDKEILMEGGVFLLGT
jgi:hypothetical protein